MKYGEGYEKKLDFEIKEITTEQAYQLIYYNHYSKVLPKLTKCILGGFIDGELKATMTLGWGTRPVHTIKAIFPSLDSKDYYEIGKMCLTEDLKKNAESQFLSRCIKWVKEFRPEIKIIYTWADGMLGKPGYVYQSANFLYGGFITTDTYLTENGEKVHPRTSQKIDRENNRDTHSVGARPTKEFLVEHNWSHWKGRQFRYLVFTCDKRTKRDLLKESPFRWNTDYPKGKDLTWTEKNLSTGKWEERTSIPYDKDVCEFNTSVEKAFNKYINVPAFQDVEELFE